jgi:hypothetical protein
MGCREGGSEGGKTREANSHSEIYQRWNRSIEAELPSSSLRRHFSGYCRIPAQAHWGLLSAPPTRAVELSTQRRRAVSLSLDSIGHNNWHLKSHRQEVQTRTCSYNGQGPGDCLTSHRQLSGRPEDRESGTGGGGHLMEERGRSTMMPRVISFHIVIARTHRIVFQPAEARLEGLLEAEIATLSFFITKALEFRWNGRR